MKKNISSLLQRGNLTPRERYILLIQNDIAEMQDALKKGKRKGKGFLSEADKEALTNWTAKTNEEAREWNRYNEGWKLSGRAGIEAEMIFEQTLAENYRKNIMATELVIYPFYRKHLNALQALKKIKVVDIKEAVEITKKQREQKLKDGLDFDYAVYRLAFESLSDEIRKDILTLDEDAEYESSYLDDEETIADLLNGKDELTKEAKEKLADRVVENSWGISDKKDEKTGLYKEYQLDNYFADIPILEIAKKWAKDKGIKPRPKDYERLEKIKGRAEKIGVKKETIKTIKDGDKKDKDEWLLEDNLKEILEDYARDNKTTIEKILKETLLKWLEEGLPYPPLVISKDRDTYNGKTKLPHNELFKEWLKAKAEAEATLKKIISKGELKAFETTPKDGIVEKIDINAEPEGIRTITGKSLYNFKGDYKFIKDFKERVDKYEPNLGIVYANEDNDPADAYLDRELLIAKKDKDGKPAIVSIFGMSLKKIEWALKPHYFKEVEKDGETYLEFNSEGIKEAFTSAVASIKDGYAKLLAFSEIFKKLNKIYEAETDHLLKQRLEQVSEFIDQHNFYLDNALEDLTGFGVGFGLYKKPLKTKSDLYIKKDRIAPDTNTIEEYGKKFYEILGDEYKY